MTKIFGDLLLHLRPLEQSLTVKLKENITYDDGYAEPGESHEMTFKGILIDKRIDDPQLQGLRDRAVRLLYVRLSQDWIPDLAEEDIVTDTKGDDWKIIERFDYEDQANCKVFGVARVDI